MCGAHPRRALDAWSAGLFVGAVLLTSCTLDRPDEATLDRWLDEARAAELEAQRAHEREDESVDWTLTVLGQVAGEPVLLRNPDLLALSTVTVGARPPLETATHATYRGVRLSTLVERAGGPLPEVTEITLVASDGFRATVAWDDAQRAPILLATHENDVRLSRERGGPLITVFPLDVHPELLERYTESFWVYYVTHVVVGTPEARVRVGETVLDGAALAALPQRSIVASVGYRVGWPSEPVRVSGPSVRDVLTAAGVTLGASDRARVMTLAPISRSPERPTTVSAEELRTGEVILGLRYGEDERPIPSRLGGPVVLAFSEAIAAAHPSHDWLTFVTDVSVEASAP